MSHFDYSCRTNFPAFWIFSSFTILEWSTPRFLFSQFQYWFNGIIIQISLQVIASKFLSTVVWFVPQVTVTFLELCKLFVTCTASIQNITIVFINYHLLFCYFLAQLEKEKHVLLHMPFWHFLFNTGYGTLTTSFQLCI